MLPSLKYSEPSTYSVFAVNQGMRLNAFFRESNNEAGKIEFPKLEHSYFVGLVFDDEINARISILSGKIKAVVPAILYGASNAHMTLANLLITREPTKTDKSIVEKLSDAIHVLPRFVTPSLDGLEWLHNGQAVIAAAKPNADFFKLAMLTRAELLTRGLKPNFPWGNHITINRFTETPSVAQAREIRNLIDTTEPLGNATPTGIVAAFTKLTPEGFELLDSEVIPIR